MKKQFYAIFVFILGLCTIMVVGVYGQDVTINGKTFEVISKTTLNTSTEFYQLKQRSTPTTTIQGYIKAGGVFNKTIFTETELKAFFLNGTLSSLGKLGEYKFTRKAKDYILHYIDKGTTRVVCSIQKGTVRFAEYLGDLKILMTPPAVASEDESVTTKLNRCNTPCFDQDDKCLSASGDPDICVIDYIYCVGQCEATFLLSQAPGRSIYSVPTLNLKVIRQ